MTFRDAIIVTRDVAEGTLLRDVIWVVRTSDASVRHPPPSPPPGLGLEAFSHPLVLAYLF